MTPSKARLELFGSGLLFGLMAVTARLAYADGRGFTSPQLAVVRFVTGIATMLVVFRLRPGTFRPRNWKLLGLRGLVGGIAVLFYFLALAHISVGEATLLNNISPFVATVLAVLFLRERATIHLWGALTLASLGIVLVLLQGGGLHFHWGLGELAGLTAALFGALAILVIRMLRPTDNALTIFFAFCSGGLLLSLPFAFGRGWPQDPKVWAIGIATGLVSVGAQVLMTDSLGALTVGEGAIWQELAPVTSYIWAFFLLDERLSWLGLVGVGLVIGGVAWGAVRGSGGAPAPQRLPEPSRSSGV